MTCPHQNDCGGCGFRGRSYPEQLEYKQRYVHNLLAPFSPSLEPVIASPAQQYYRNKMEFVISAPADSLPQIGQRRKNSFNSVVDISACPVFHPRAGDVCAMVREWMAAQGLPAYDLQRGGQGMRYITLRHAKAGDELMLTLTYSSVSAVQADRYALACSSLAERLVREKIAVSVYSCSNDAASDRAVSGKLACIAGRDHIREEVNGVGYRIYPQTFFQTNPFCCGLLYDKVKEYAGPGRERAIDLFCGSGGISLQLAAGGRQVTGIDNSAENCRCARVNAADNNLNNVDFVCSDAQEYLQGLRPGEAGVLVVDPPRQGLTKRSRSLLAGSGIPVIVYVSCNPLTLAEDLKALSAAYKVEKAVPVDMFPHTPHIETVVKLVAG